MKKSRTFVALAMACALPAFAADPVVLKNQDVTESALIDALSVAPEPSGAKTRGFRPSTPVLAPNRPAGAGQANLLITFETSSARLTSESQTALDTVGKALQSDALADRRFRVEGHADARGDAGQNRRLSQQRAQAVVSYLVDKRGIVADRLTPQGKGSAEPLNKTRVDAPENRRVTIVTVRE
jgi:outer membrane protein OmpA-like peptidoglycan-associated protein